MHLHRLPGEGVQQRAMEVPIPPGNYRGLSVGENHLYWITSNTTSPRKPRLQALKIDNKKPEIKTVIFIFAEVRVTIIDTCH